MYGGLSGLKTVKCEISLETSQKRFDAETVSVIDFPPIWNVERISHIDFVIDLVIASVIDPTKCECAFFVAENCRLWINFNVFGFLIKRVSAD